MMNAGIYEIFNTASGKRYVGSAVDFGGRWKAHRHRLRNNRHHAKHLQFAWNKYGESAFLFRKLIICAKEHLLMYEQRSIDLLRPEYNVAHVAGSSLGVKHAPGVYAVRAAAMIGNKYSLGVHPSAETIAKLAVSRKLFRHTPESRAKLSHAHMGKTLSQEHRAKLSMAKIGRTLTAEHKAKIGTAGLGRKHSVESRAKLSTAHTGKIVSAETRAKIVAVRTGSKASPEACASMRAAQIARRLREKQAAE